MLVGTGVSVGVGGISVTASVEKSVGVLNVGMSVMAGVTGVCGGRLGTQRDCPTRIVVLEPRQLACCSWEVVMPNIVAM